MLMLASYRSFVIVRLVNVNRQQLSGVEPARELTQRADELNKTYTNLT